MTKQQAKIAAGKLSPEAAKALKEIYEGMRKTWPTTNDAIVELREAGLVVVSSMTLKEFKPLMVLTQSGRKVAEQVSK